VEGNGLFVMQKDPEQRSFVVELIISKVRNVESGPVSIFAFDSQSSSQ
jgi:hypothetical protein